jgi:hypothetical protein
VETKGKRNRTTYKYFNVGENVVGTGPPAIPKSLHLTHTIVEISGRVNSARGRIPRSFAAVKQEKKFPLSRLEERIRVGTKQHIYEHIEKWVSLVRFAMEAGIVPTTFSGTTPSASRLYFSPLSMRR